MQSKTFSYFGFAVRSGNLKTGLNSIRFLKGKVFLTVVCHTASENTKKEILKLSHKFGCPLIESKSHTLSEYTSKENCKVAAVTDFQLAKVISENINSD